MKKLSLALAAVVLALGLGQLAAADGKDAWLTDYPKAQALAKEQKKAILMDFTGSDWCPPCMQLKKTVLSNAEFTKFAAEKLVLVEVDFPQEKKQSEELKKANAELEKKFKIDGYPTIIVVDAEGKELFRDSGYDGSSAKEYVAKLSKALSKK
ncbi:MAG: thioredoxin [Verrucomicrobia bacterium]|jgi:protein disulfide-isomerase|nr:thioredoxin [Verrucomicrobiota bacterium]